MEKKSKVDEFEKEALLDVSIEAKVEKFVSSFSTEELKYWGTTFESEQLTRDINKRLLTLYEVCET